jgi:polyisoprenoid-binding protein YceI
MVLTSDSSILYSLDARASQFTVQAFAEGISGIADHRPRFLINDFSGEAVWNQARIQLSALDLTIKASSLSLIDEVSENDRRQINRALFEEVLESSRFPDINFRTSQVTAASVAEKRYRIQVSGLLTLHGVSAPHSVEGQLLFGDGSFRAYGEFRLSQTKHDIKIASVAGGLVCLKDELKFSFYIIGRQQR